MNNLATVLGKLGREEEALATYRSLVARNANMIEAYLGMGATLCSLARYDEAVATYERAVALAPKDAQARYGLGKAFQGAGRLDEAIANLQAAVELIGAPLSMSEPPPNRGLPDHGKEVYGCSSVCAGSHCINPRLPEAYANLATIHYELNQYEEAERVYKELLALEGLASDTAVKNKLALGTVLRSLQHYDEAERLLDEVIAEHPDDAYGADARKDKALMYLNLGRLAEGWPLYEYRTGGPALSVPDRPPQWDFGAIDGPLLVRSERGSATRSCTRA